MLSTSDIIFVIGAVLIFYLIFRKSLQRHKRLAPIADYYKGKAVGLCDWLINVNGRSVQLRVIEQNPDKFDYLLLLLWEQHDSEEWYLLPERAQPYLMWKWNETTFEHAGENWIIGAKKIDPTLLTPKIKPGFEKYHGLFSSQFAILRVASETRVTGKGIKNVVVAKFQGLPDNLQNNPSQLRPYLEELPTLVDQLS